MTAQFTPPVLLRRMVASLLPHADRSQVIEDLDELYEHRVAKHGRASANLWYVRQLGGFVLRAATLRTGVPGIAARDSALSLEPWRGGLGGRAGAGSTDVKPSSGFGGAAAPQAPAL